MSDRANPAGLADMVPRGIGIGNRDFNAALRIAAVGQSNLAKGEGLVMSNLSAAEFIVIGLLIGFLAVAIATSMKPRRTDAVSLDSKTRRELEAMVEQIVDRHKMDPAQLEALLERVVAAKLDEMSAKLESVAVAAKKAAAEAADAPAPAAADTSATKTVDEGAPAVEAGKVAYRVHVDGEVFDLSVDVGENMLHAALDREVDLDYSCLEGNCDSCQVTVLKGAEFLTPITNEERDMIDQEDLDKGERLACMVKFSAAGAVEIKQER